MLKLLSEKVNNDAKHVGHQKPLNKEVKAKTCELFPMVIFNQNVETRKSDRMEG